MNLTHITDKTLLEDTKDLARRYRHVTAQLLHHLREIEKRRLFADLGYPSLFDYVVRELGFSEPSAARRIKAARLIEEVPELEKKIQDGSLTLTNVALVAQTLKNENINDSEVKKTLLEGVENKSSREAEKTIRNILAPSPVRQTFYRSFQWSDDTCSKLNTLKGLLAHRKLSENELFNLVFKLAIAAIQKEKFKTKSKSSSRSSNSRYIPAGLKKAVFEKSKSCENCGSDYALEIDHRIPFALGGKTELSNLRLLCRSCNQRKRIKAKL